TSSNLTFLALSLTDVLNLSAGLVYSICGNFALAQLTDLVTDPITIIYILS
ncbi:hypothetical protein BgiMline_023858, partial [Biomphalaria glabrata]